MGNDKSEVKVVEKSLPKKFPFKGRLSFLYEIQKGTDSHRPTIIFKTALMLGNQIDKMSKGAYLANMLFSVDNGIPLDIMSEIFYAGIMSGLEDIKTQFLKDGFKKYPLDNIPPPDKKQMLLILKHHLDPSSTNPEDMDSSITVSLN
jgi:hypothetical protein